MTSNMRRECCFFVHDGMMKAIADHPDASEHSKAVAKRSLQHNHRHRTDRSTRTNPSRHDSQSAQGFVAPQTHKAVANSTDATDEQRQRAGHQLKADAGVRSARAGARTAPAGKGKGSISRVIYDCKSHSDLPGTKLRKEGEDSDLPEHGLNVWNAFEMTYDFYMQIMGRDSIDGEGLVLEGSINYDDDEPPPGYDNAMWNGDQMVFGTGDATIFQDFTRCVDIIAHELTHGVVQYTAVLPYHLQSGALNESFADTFASMVIQWNGGKNMQTVEDATWLMGGGVFYPKVDIKGVRSLKAPGTAYKDKVIGSDTQPAHMKDYQEVPDDADNDSGGVHNNSGIPNHAFYLACTKLGGHSWEVVGKVWYDCLVDPALKTFSADEGNYDKVFAYFASLTVKHAAKYSTGGKDAAKSIAEAWEEVGIDASKGSDGTGFSKGASGESANGTKTAGRKPTVKDEDEGEDGEEGEAEDGEADGEEEEEEDEDEGQEEDEEGEGDDAEEEEPETGEEDEEGEEGDEDEAGEDER